MEKETLPLPDIIDVLGERPFPMKESVREYLTEMTKRREEEVQEK